jgi:autotransporter-associated beta strand protein
MVFEGLGANDISGNGIVITSNNAASSFSFSGTNAQITQNGTGSVSFANGTATTDLTLNSTDLTINGTGFGHVTLAGVIGGTGNLIIDHTGTSAMNTGGQIFVAPGAANTFTGNIVLNNGNLTLNTTAVPLAAAGTLVINGGTVRGSSAFSLSNAVTLNSRLVQVGVLGSTYNGVISGNGGIRLASHASVSTIFSNTISGTGTIEVEGYGFAAPTFSLISTATTNGTALNAAGYNINLGTLSISNATANATRLNSAAPLVLNNGTFSFTAGGSLANGETLASTTITGNALFTLNGVTTAPTTINAGTLTRTGNSTFLVNTNTVTGTVLGGTPGANGSVNLLFGSGTGITNTNGVLPYGFSTIATATVISNELVRYDATRGVVPLSGTDYLNGPAVGFTSNATGNVRASFGATSITGNRSVNSLMLTSPSGAATGTSLIGDGTLKATINVTSGLIGVGINGGTTASSYGSLIDSNIALGSTTGHIQNTNIAIFSGSFSGSNGLVKAGTGAAVLYGDNSSLTGGLTVTNGNLLFVSDSNLGAAGGSVTLSAAQGGGLLSFNSLREFTPLASTTLSVNRPTTLNGAGGLVVSQSNTTMNWNGVISGTGRFGKVGAGVLGLNGTNSFTGDVSLFAGTLIAGSDAALGNAANNIVFNNGASVAIFQFGSSFTTARNFLFNSTTASAATIFDNGFDTTISGALVGGQTSVTFLKAGSGNMTLTGLNTINGPITVGDLTPTRRTGANFAQTGGTLTLSGANGSLAGGTSYTFNYATVHLDNTAAINQNRLSSSSVTLNGSELKLTGNTTANMADHMGRAAATGLVSNSLFNTLTVVQPNSGGGNRDTTLVFTGYTVAGVATTLFRGNNLGVTAGGSDTTHIRFATAPTQTNGIIASGLYANSTTGLAEDLATHTTAEGIGRFNTYTALPASGAVNTTNYNLTGPLAMTAAQAANAIKLTDAAIDLAGNTLSVTGAGALLVTSAASNPSTITTTTGTPDLAFGAAPARITVNTTLTVGSVANPVRLTGSGGLNKAGPGTLEVSSSTLSGPLNVSQGTYRLLGTAGWVSGTTVTMMPGATLDFNNLGTTATPVGTMALNGFGTVAIGTGAIAIGSATATYGGAFTGTTGTLLQTGTSTQTLNGNSPGFAGDVQILAGTLSVDSNVRPTDSVNPGALGTGTTPIQIGATTGANLASLHFGTNVTEFNRSIVVPAGVPNTTAFSLRTVNGSIGTIGGNITLSRDLRLDNTSFSSAATGYYTITGTIADGTAPGSIDWFGGNFNLHAANTFTGGIFLQAASTLILGLGHDSALGTGPILIANQTFTGVFRADNGNRTISNSIDYEAGSTSNTIGFTGVNNLTFTAANFSLLNSAAATTRTWNVIGPGVVTFNGNLNQTGGGAASLIKTGAGILVLNGTTSNFSGGTTINSGTLRIGNTSGSATGAGSITVNAGGRFEGTGIASGLATVNANGIIAGGNGVSGSLTVGGITFATGSFMAVGITDGSTPGAISTGTSTVNAASNTSIINTGTITTLGNASLLIDLANTLFANPDTAHSFRIATGFGDQSGLNITDSTRFTFFNLNPNTINITTVSLTGDVSGNVYLNFTPVPEPMTILAVGLTGLVVGRRLRRRVTA